MDDKERLIIVEKQTEINTKKIEDHDKQIDELRRTYSLIETMTLRIGNVEDTVKLINSKLDRQEQQIQAESGKDDKKKAELFDYIYKGIITIILGFLAIKLGLK